MVSSGVDASGRASIVLRSVESSIGLRRIKRRENRRVHGLYQWSKTFTFSSGWRLDFTVSCGPEIENFWSMLASLKQPTAEPPFAAEIPPLDSQQSQSTEQLQAEQKKSVNVDRTAGDSKL